MKKKINLAVFCLITFGAGLVQSDNIQMYSSSSSSQSSMTQDGSKKTTETVETRIKDGVKTTTTTTETSDGNNTEVTKKTTTEKVGDSGHSRQDDPRGERDSETRDSETRDSETVNSTQNDQKKPSCSCKTVGHQPKDSPKKLASMIMKINKIQPNQGNRLNTPMNRSMDLSMDRNLDLSPASTQLASLDRLLAPLFQPMF